MCFLKVFVLFQSNKKSTKLIPQKLDFRQKLNLCITFEHNKCPDTQHHLLKRAYAPFISFTYISKIFNDKTKMRMTKIKDHKIIL